MNLVALFEEALEFQNFNGSVLSNGKVKVYFIGRTSLADIYNDVAGEYPSENPKILDNLGMGPIYVNPAFDYEIVVYDEYDNELFSVKKYLHSSGAHSTSNVEVVPSENIQVSAWTQGDVQVYMPYITGNLGKVYSGVEPIVVNNDEDKISANHVALGLQEPLFFVQDDENACIIGCSAQTEIPSSVSSKWEDASDTVSSNSAQWNIGTVYTAGNYIDIDNDVISVTGLQPAGDYAYNSAVSSKLDTTAFSTVSGDFLTAVDLTPYQEKSAMSGYLTTGDSAQFYTNDNPSGFITGVDLSDYATKDFVNDNIDSATSGLLPTSAFATASGSFITALPSDLVYTADITGKLDTSVYATDSAMFSGAIDYVSANVSDPVTSPLGTILVNGSEIEATNSAIKTSVIPSASALLGETIGISYDPTIFNFTLPVTGGTLYAVQDVHTAGGKINFSGKDVNNVIQTGILNIYWETGTYTADLGDIISDISAMSWSNITLDHLSATSPEVNSSSVDELAWKTDLNDLPSYNYLQANYQPQSAMTAYQLSGDYLTTADSVNFYPISNPSGFITGVDLTPYQTTAGMTAYQPAGDYLTTADSAQFITALPADLVYTADITGFATTADLTSKLDKSDSANFLLTSDSGNFYTTANESGFITGIPSEVTAAASAVSSNSANWNSTYNTVSANSADWSVSEEISGTNGIKISESADKVIIEVSADYYLASNPSGFITGVDLTPYQTTAGMTAYQPVGSYLTTADSANFYTTANESGYLTAVPAGYATEDWVTGQGYITGINYNTGSI